MRFLIAVVLAGGVLAFNLHPVHVKVGTGPSTICGDNSGALTWRRYAGAADALYADIDTSSCSFRDVPVYVANLIEGQGAEGEAANAGAGRSAGSLTVTAHAVGSFRVVLWDPSLLDGGDGGSEGGGEGGGKRRSDDAAAEALLAATRARGWTVEWVGDTGSNSGVTLPGHTEWRELPADEQGAAGEDRSGVLYVDVDTRACGFDTTPSYFVTLNGAAEGGGAGGGAALSNSMAAVHGVEFFRTSGASMVYAARPTGFRVYVRAAHLAQITDASLRVGVVNDLKWTLSWVGVDRAIAAAGADVSGDAASARPVLEGVGENGGIGGTGAAPTWATALGARGTALPAGARPALYSDVPTGRSGFKVIPTYIASLSSDAPFHAVFAGGTLITGARYNSFRLFVAQPGATGGAGARALAPSDLAAGDWRVNYFGYDGLPPVRPKSSRRGARPLHHRSATLGSGGSGLVGATAAALDIGDEHGLRIDRVRAQVRSMPLETWLAAICVAALLWYKKHLAVQSQERLYHRRRRRRNLDWCSVNPNSTAMYELEDEKEDIDLYGSSGAAHGDKVRRRSNPASGKKRESLKAIRNAFSQEQRKYGGGEPRRESERRISDMEGGGPRRRSGVGS